MTYDDYEDDGTMPANVAELSAAVIGRRIVSTANTSTGTALTLDDGRTVTLVPSSDCCAFTELESFLLHPEAVDHIILGVSADENYTTWHIFADFGDVMTLKVGWSCGNPFYYGYGFDIQVTP